MFVAVLIGIIGVGAAEHGHEGQEEMEEVFAHDEGGMTPFDWGKKFPAQHGGVVVANLKAKPYVWDADTVCWYLIHIC